MLHNVKNIKTQQGRSMIEMLSVLAVIGVLSILVTWGYRKAITLYKTNNLLEDAKRAGFVIVADEIVKRLPVIDEDEQNDMPLDGLFQKDTAYTFSAFKESDAPDAVFGVIAGGVEPNVCREVIKRKVDWSVEIHPNGLDNECHTDTPNNITFFYNGALTSDEEYECKSDEDCGAEVPYCCKGYCQAEEDCTCNGKWRQVTNYAADGSENELGEQCCAEGYDTAVDGVCCDASKPYCKQVAYLERTGYQYIETDYYANNNTTIDIMYKVVQFQNDLHWAIVPFGARTAYQKNQFGLFSPVNSKNTLMAFYGNQQRNYSLNPLGIDIHFMLDKNIATLNSDVYAFPEQTFTNQYTLRLFSMHSDGSGGGQNNGGILRIYYAKIYDNHIPVYDFIPVVDNNGKAGMYDKVTGRVFYNKGTGKFIAGE